MNTNSKRGEAAMGLFVFFMLFAMFIGCYYTGVTVTERIYQNQAVTHGFAIWVVDNSGNTTFQWKETK